MNSNEVLKTAREFMKENGFNEPIQEFFDSDKVQAKAHEWMDAFNRQTNILLEVVPEHLKERAEEVARRIEAFPMNEFLADIKSSFICNIYDGIESLLRLSETYAYRTTIIETVKMAITPENDLAIEFINELMEKYIDVCINMSINQIYRGYVPKGMPKEVMEFIQEISGGSGVCIPVAVAIKLKDSKQEPEESEPET